MLQPMRACRALAAVTAGERVPRETALPGSEMPRQIGEQKQLQFFGPCCAGMAAASFSAVSVDEPSSNVMSRSAGTFLCVSIMPSA